VGDRRQSPLQSFIGLMLIESLIKRHRKRVALFVPKAARKPVWEDKLRRYLPEIFGEYSNLAIYNHTDLLRGGEYPDRLKRISELADVIIIDEAHHFRNPGLKGEDPPPPVGRRNVIRREWLDSLGPAFDQALLWFARACS
jgi:hypothetical protein